MGKAQSKRSVDITTEAKKGEDEITEKMEKIEDTDRKEVNGEATVDPQHEKKGNDDSEIDKDATTEKSEETLAGGDAADQCKSSIAESFKEEGSASEEISPLTDENSKKSKKEKVKKKWSFRSISFGKKDKQKPTKTEDLSETAGAVTNGTGGESPDQETDVTEKENNTSEKCPDGKSMNIHENGTTAEEEKPVQQTEEVSSDVKTNEETAKTTNSTAEKNEIISNTAEDIASQETDKTPKISSKPDVVDIENMQEKNDISNMPTNERCVEEINATVNHSEKDPAADEVTADNKNIPAEIETVTVNGKMDDIHQNGSESVFHQDVEETKAQIEVKSNTDIKSSADSLEIISSTSYNTSNDQVHDTKIDEVGNKIDDVGMAKVDVKQEVSQSLNGSCTKTHDNNEEIDLNVSKVEPQDNPSVVKLVHEPSPPPLPISPPPSHVSVFAFKNKEESDESTGKNKQFITQPEAYNETVRYSLNSTELVNQRSITDETLESDEKEIVAVIEMENNEKECLKNYEETGSAKEAKIQTVLSTSNSQSDIKSEMKNVEEIVVNENDAIKEIIHEHIDHEKPTTQEKLEVESNRYEEDYVVEDTAMSIPSVQNTKITHTTDDLDEKSENKENNLQNQTQESCLNTKEDNELNLYCESEKNPHSQNLGQSQTDKEITELDIHHEICLHDKTGSDNIENLVREETKDITNIKDLNESAAITEITQDPSITCE